MCYCLRYVRYMHTLLNNTMCRYRYVTYSKIPDHLIIHSINDQSGDIRKKMLGNNVYCLKSLIGVNKWCVPSPFVCVCVCCVRVSVCVCVFVSLYVASGIQWRADIEVDTERHRPTTENRVQGN